MSGVDEQWDARVEAVADMLRESVLDAPDGSLWAEAALVEETQELSLDLKPLCDFEAREDWLDLNVLPRVLLDARKELGRLREVMARLQDADLDALEVEAEQLSRTMAEDIVANGLYLDREETPRLCQDMHEVLNDVSREIGLPPKMEIEQPRVRVPGLDL